MANYNYLTRVGTNKSKLALFFVATVLALTTAIGVLGSVGASTVTPSTNDENRDKGWAHFNVLGESAGTFDVKFVSTRGFASCFEYRIDGEATTDTRSNFNTNITDGLWPFVCVNNNTADRTFITDKYFEVRMVFGAERDERFDWTRVYVASAITSPEAGEEILLGEMLNLAAHDYAAASGGVQWAVRKGTCEAGTNTVAGNVDGFSTTFSWAGGVFSASVDTTGFEAGQYCFIFNPRQGDRLTRNFELVEPQPVVLSEKDQCKNGGWESFGFRNQGLCIQFVNTGRDSR